MPKTAYYTFIASKSSHILDLKNVGIPEYPLFASDPAIKRSLFMNTSSYIFGSILSKPQAKILLIAHLAQHNRYL